MEETPKSNFDPYSLYRNAGDGVHNDPARPIYVPYPMKPETRAKLERQGIQVVYPRRLRSPFWKTLAAALAVVLRVSALTLLAYVVALLVTR